MAQQGSSSSSLSSTAFDEYNTKLQTSALKATRNAATLPADINFYRSLDTGTAHDIDSISSRVLNLTNKLLELSNGVNDNAPEKAKGKGKGKAKLEDKDDVVDDFHSLVVDAMDQLFERTDSCLDQAMGRNKAPAIAVNPPQKDKVTQKRKVITSKGALDPVIHHAAHLEKPQTSFKRKPDNSDTPWYPSLSHKFNAKVPLGYVYTEGDGDVTIEGNSTPVANHPYRYEINHISYPSHVYAPANPTPPLSLSETPFTWVSTPSTLQTMLNKLRASTEIAVDLEHHSYRSYAGFLCLMQISTREEDFVVDVIALRDDMEVLNEVFTDSKIVKVFHGAESDIVWLQQDFNLYVVNLFDTFHASKLLDFPRHGLANLLEMYCDYIPDKRYQLADWRIRPLPEAMLEYARSDTHFLLFIYDNLRNALLDRATSRSRSSSPPTTTTATSLTTNTNPNAPVICVPPPTANASTSPAHTLINHVLTRSAETCLRVYTKETYDHSSGSGSNGWDTLAKKWNKPFFTSSSSPPSSSSTSASNQVLTMQKQVYISLHQWRDKIAREEDESTRYVMPNQYLFRIAESPPSDLGALLRVFGMQVPVVVKRRAKELVEVIREGVRKGLSQSQSTGDDAGAGAGAGAESGGEVKDTQEKEKEAEVEVKKPADSVRVEQISKETNEKLWGTTNQNPLIQPSSSLFGTLPTKTPSSSSSAKQVYTSTQSTLFGNFGNSITSESLSTPERQAGATKFQEVVARINSTLVIAPTAPKATPAITTSTTTATATTTTEETQETSTEMQIEIPFVPASQRQAQPPMEEKEKDTIVVVGQSKSKKRKRTKSALSTDKLSSKSKAKANGSEEEGAGDEEQFDFASVPNILDDNPQIMDEKEKRVKKKQKKGKGGQFFGDFPAPPKAHKIPEPFSELSVELVKLFTYDIGACAWPNFLVVPGLDVIPSLPSVPSDMTTHSTLVGILLLFITALNLFYIRKQLLVQDHHGASQREYSLLGHDYPEFLPLPIALTPDIPVVAEETVHYPVLGNASDAEWFSLTSAGYGYVRLGGEHRVFMVTMYHELHCLRVLNKAFGKHPIATPGHIQHCLNYLRQGALCHPDLSLEPGNFEEKDFGVERTGAIHMCRDWEAPYEVMSERLDLWLKETWVHGN
ncbi:hypothetical protein NP233_g3891 [Leucocoprinus birnbaumii]|uniref:HRDC domain-containing protein n=1 Tax=Leucocoprinus birnbaumii TaxID=56174 RepID=A0AAD5YTH2_9AGAR|nr:hypothetical protein NP233_g3891 [Leucocoprinus birnbaumii]